MLKRILGVQTQIMELVAISLAKIKNWDSFANFSKLGLALTPKIMSVEVENIDMFVPIVRVSIQQESVKIMKKNKKTNNFLY